MQRQKPIGARLCMGIATAATALIALAAQAQTTASAADYELVADHKLGAPNFWDYLTYDTQGKILYVAHIDKVEALDVKSGKSLGHVGPFHDTHGIAIASDLSKGYADSGDDGVVKVFRLSDLSVTKTIKV